MSHITYGTIKTTLYYTSPGTSTQGLIHPSHTSFYKLMIKHYHNSNALGRKKTQKHHNKKTPLKFNVQCLEQMVHMCKTLLFPELIFQVIWVQNTYFPGFPILVKFLLAQIKLINMYLENYFILLESQTTFAPD